MHYVIMIEEKCKKCLDKLYNFFDTMDAIIYRKTILKYMHNVLN